MRGSKRGTGRVATDPVWLERVYPRRPRTTMVGGLRMRPRRRRKPQTTMDAARSSSVESCCLLLDSALYPSISSAPDVLLLPALLGSGGKRWRWVGAKILDCVGARPEIRRPITIGYTMVHRFQPVLEVCGDRPQLLVAHVTEGYPGHRRRQVSRTRWKISLAWGRRSDLDIRCLARTQPVAQRVEDLSFAESSQPRRVVGRQIARARLERADLELPGIHGGACQKARIQWARYARGVAIGAAVIQYQLAAMYDLLLPSGHVVAAGV